MKFRYIENDKSKPIPLLRGTVAVTYKNNMRVEKPVLCIEAGSWKEARHTRRKPSGKPKAGDRQMELFPC